MENIKYYWKEWNKYFLWGFGIALIIILSIKPVEVEAQTLQQNNFSFVFNISSASIGEWTISQAVGQESPSGQNGNNFSGCNPSNLSQSDNVYCRLLNTGVNTEPFIRFNFTISGVINPNQFNNITSVRIDLEGGSPADQVLYQHFNRTGANTLTRRSFAPASATEVNRNVTYNTKRDIESVINNVTNQSLIMLYGGNHDDNENIFVDFVQIVVNLTNYTLVSDEQPANTAPSFTNGYPVINSSNGLNQTNQNLNVIFIANDTQNSTFSFNVTWIMNNITNFTTILKNNYANNTINITNLDKSNLTVGQTWIAMVNLFDGQFITRKNTSELLILTTPTDTCTPPASGTWNINAGDNCVWITNQIVPGDVHCFNTGTANLYAEFRHTGTNQRIIVSPGCIFNINQGGSFI